MRYLLLVLFSLGACAAAAHQLTICYNYGCSVEASVDIDGNDYTQLNQLFTDIDNAPMERESISLAMGYMGQIAGAQTPIFNDKGGNSENEEGVDGRMDCIDHSRTTTAYLRFIEAQGWLQFHRVLEPIHRAPLLLNDHWSARIEDTASGEQYAVDTWFLDNGEPAVILPVREWLKGASPHG
jgi:hypothetical protein